MEDTRLNFTRGEGFQKPLEVCVLFYMGYVSDTSQCGFKVVFYLKRKDMQAVWQ